MKKHDCDNRCQKSAIQTLFMEIEFYLSKLENRKKKKTVLLEITSYNVPQKMSKSQVCSKSKKM